MNDGIIYSVWLICQVFLITYLVIPLLLFIVQKLKPEEASAAEQNEPDVGPADYAIIVTAFEQTHLLPSLINSILNLEYQNYLIYVVADNCDISNLKFDDKKVILLRPEKVIANNIGSHFYAIDRFKRKHNRLTILDSDNIVHPRYLSELNLLFKAGFQAVQGVREAKNIDTTYARLDAARDLYYRFYDAKLLFELGSSSTLSGSGMAFNTDLYIECSKENTTNGAGFDKLLQFALVDRNIRIAFAPKAIVYDAKTMDPDQLVKQRSRWILTWFKFFGLGFKLIVSSIRNFSWNQFLFAIILIRPPLFILLILSLLSLAANIWISHALAYCLLISLLSFVSAFCIAVIRKDTNKEIYSSFIDIPKFIFYQLVSLTQIGRANKVSISTKHPVKMDDTDHIYKP